jgi:FAD/FMN-containing dehydrogenase
VRGPGDKNLVRSNDSCQGYIKGPLETTPSPFLPAQFHTSARSPGSGRDRYDNIGVEHFRDGVLHGEFDFVITVFPFNAGYVSRVVRRGGSYYLTYHRDATRGQVESCYPQFAQFLRLKKQYDPDERFQSDWYRHYRKMFADSL